MTPHELEAMLAQDDWLRRIARRLVRDPDLADDMAQDAWVASLEHRQHAKPWLAVVLRNAATRYFRTEGRERARRQDSAQLAADAAPATDEIVADLELRGRLASELAGLEDPFRGAVYLRFVANLSLKEVARRTGVAPSTASERVTRGLDLLRKRMDRAHGGDRRAWAVHLIPLAQPAGSTKILLGALAMTGSLKVALAAVVVISLVVIGVQLTGPQAAARQELAEVENDDSPADLADISSVPVDLASVTAPDDARTGALDAGVAAQSADAISTAKDTPAHITAHFRLVDGRPAEGARWSLYGRSGNADRVRKFGAPDYWVNLSGTLDATGKLDISFDPPQAFQFGLKVVAPGHVTASWRWGSIEPHGAMYLGEVSLRAAGAIAGRVVDTEGKPVTGRSMTVYAEVGSGSLFVGMSAMEPVFRRVTVDADSGLFTIDGLPEGLIRLTVESGVLGSVKGPRVRVVARETAKTEIVLSGLDAAAARILVNAVCRPYFGVPKPECIWLVAQDGSRRHAEMRENSITARFEGTDAGRYRVEIIDPRFEPWSQDDVEPDTRVFAQLRGSASVVLDVRDSEGELVSIYSVDLEILNSSYWPNTFQPHDGEEPLPDDLLEGLLPGDHQLTIRGAPGIASVRVDALEACERRAVSVVFGPPDIVSGRVVYADGTSASGAHVRLVRPAERDDSPRSRIMSSNASESAREVFRWTQDDVTANEGGHFTFEFPPNGPYIIVAGDDGRPRIESTPFPYSVGQRIEDIELVLPVGAQLTGRIQQPAGLDLTNWRVLPQRPDDSQTQRLAVSATLVVGGASFDCGALPSGTVDLYLFRPGAGVRFDADGVPLDAQLLERIVLIEGQDVDRAYPFPFALPTAVLFVVHVEGLAATEATVRLFPAGGPRELYRFDGTLERVGPVDVQPGDYDVWVTGPGWGAALQEPFSITAGGPGTIEIDVKLKDSRARIVRGGEPITSEGFSVHVSNSDVRLLQSFRTDDAGSADLRLPAGDYFLRAGHPGTWGKKFTWPLPDGVTEIEVE